MNRVCALLKIGIFVKRQNCLTFEDFSSPHHRNHRQFLSLRPRRVSKCSVPRLGLSVSWNATEEVRVGPRWSNGISWKSASRQLAGKDRAEAL